MGRDSDMNLRATDHPEFDAWRWNEYWVPLDVVIEFKRDVYQMALSELARYLPRPAHHNRYLRAGMRPHGRDDHHDGPHEGHRDDHPDQADHDMHNHAPVTAPGPASDGVPAERGGDRSANQSDFLPMHEGTPHGGPGSEVERADTPTETRPGTPCTDLLIDLASPPTTSAMAGSPIWPITGTSAISKL
jgi:hypothetical protein